MKKVTKADLIDSIFKTSSYERQTIQNVVDSFLQELKAEMEKGSTIEFRGFGTFEVRQRKGKEKARNPQNGEICSVPPHCVAAFRAGQELKKALFDLKLTEEDADK